ncbi:acyltransferase family protein [Desulfobacter vibrioformis]|uniref:acyltransferase family protein n=1 Tax=Desulfobacter vibrioformis TaxID=34031 RepID=UPI00068BF9BA|nr:acyltransferase family protein [Desulfobacter vibrioformis]
MRIQWLDNLRAIGIFFVVLGHTPGLPEPFEKIIFSFHMPLFFWLSGLMCKDKIKQISFRAFIKNKAYKLLVPYLFFSIISYVSWFVLFRHFGSQAKLNLSPITPLIGIIYGNGIHHLLAHNTVLWFFLCLFATEIFFFFIIRLESKTRILAALILLSAIGYIDVWLNPPLPDRFRLPWNIDIALTAVVFYGAGYLLSPYLLKNRLNFIVNLGFGICYLFFSLINSKVALVAGVYGNFFYFYSAAFSGILFWKAVAEYLSTLFNMKLDINTGQTFRVRLGKAFAKKLARPCRFIETLMLKTGENTLTIFVFHLLVFPLLTAVQVYIFKIPASVKHDSIVFSFIYTVVSIIMLLPVSSLLQRYLPWSVGRFKTAR